MKIYDCITYLNEDLILSIRFNILYDYVDYFVIVEGNRTHSGIKKKKNFQIKKFLKFKKKNYIFFYIGVSIFFRQMGFRKLPKKLYSNCY